MRAGPFVMKGNAMRTLTWEVSLDLANCGSNIGYMILM